MDTKKAAIIAQEVYAMPTDEIIKELSQRGGNIADCVDLSRDEIIERAVQLRMIAAVIEEAGR